MDRATLKESFIDQGISWHVAGKFTSNFIKECFDEEERSKSSVNKSKRTNNLVVSYYESTTSLNMEDFVDSTDQLRFDD